MIYFYCVKLCFYVNNSKVFKEYVVSFVDLIDFLFNKKKKNSSMEIYSIKPYYPKRGKFIYVENVEN